MGRFALFRYVGWLTLLIGSAVGCGTTRMSDSARTATEQILISDAVDRAISEIDFTVLANRDVFLQTKYFDGSVDDKYVIGTLRQHMLASGCVVKEKIDEAQYVVELRAGAIGTNRNDLLFGVPQTSLPTGGLFPVAPTSIPEIPLMKRTNQQGVARISVFAYDRLTGQPVWQSGTRQIASKAKDIWIFGTGPFQSGTIYDGKVKFAGERLQVPISSLNKTRGGNDNVWVSKEYVFQPPPAAQQSPVMQAAAPNAQPQSFGDPPAGGAAGLPPEVASRPRPDYDRAGYSEPVQPSPATGNRIPPATLRR